MFVSKQDLAAAAAADEDDDNDDDYDDRDDGYVNAYGFSLSQPRAESK